MLRKVPVWEWLAMAFIACFTVFVMALCWVKLGRRWAVTEAVPMRNATRVVIESMFTCTDLDLHLLR